MYRLRQKEQGSTQASDAHGKSSSMEPTDDDEEDSRVSTLREAIGLDDVTGLPSDQDHSSPSSETPDTKTLKMSYFGCVKAEVRTTVISDEERIFIFLTIHSRGISSEVSPWPTTGPLVPHGHLHHMLTICICCWRPSGSTTSSQYTPFKPYFPGTR